MCTSRLLQIALLTLAVAGCALQAPPSQPPPPDIAPGTWRQVDSEILAASQDARQQAERQAHTAMRQWRERVLQRTDTDFIPWFSSAWTQQWLGMKVAWYKLGAEEGKDPTVARLAAYMQDRFRDRVLLPVAREIDPGQVMAQANGLYVRHLDASLQNIPARHGLAQALFEQWLAGIAAIAPGAPAGASLLQLVRAEPLERLPAYRALVERIQDASAGEGLWSEHEGISGLARQTSEHLANELATTGVAGVVSTVVGGVAGMALSLGAVGLTGVQRENRRPAMETQLRQSLHAAFDAQWLELMHDPDSGVLAGVGHISGQIEASLAERLAQPPAAQPQPVSDAPPLHYGDDGVDAAPYLIW